MSVAFALVVLAGCAAPRDLPVAVVTPTEEPAPQPLVTAITPESGSLVAGEAITISGESLDGVTKVTFDGIAAPTVTLIDTQNVEVVVPQVGDYLPSTAVVEVFAGATAIPASTPLTYSFEILTPVDRQLNYAFTHWSNYNTAEYGDFNASGGDCMNFVSQTLIARGWEMTDAWYSRNGGSQYKSSWIYVPAFDKWLRSHPEYGAVELSLEQRDQVKVGDLVMFDWNDNNLLDHIQVVSAVTVVDGFTQIKMVGHNRDYDYRDLDETITVDHPGGAAWFWSLP